MLGHVVGELQSCSTAQPTETQAPGAEASGTGQCLKIQVGVQKQRQMGVGRTKAETTSIHAPYYAHPQNPYECSHTRGVAGT